MKPNNEIEHHTHLPCAHSAVLCHINFQPHSRCRSNDVKPRHTTFLPMSFGYHPTADKVPPCTCLLYNSKPIEPALIVSCTALCLLIRPSHTAGQGLTPQLPWAPSICCRRALLAVAAAAAVPTAVPAARPSRARALRVNFSTSHPTPPSHCAGRPSATLLSTDPPAADPASRPPTPQCPGSPSRRKARTAAAAHRTGSCELAPVAPLPAVLV